MDVETALREIDEANSKHVGSETYERQREEYEQTLREVNRIGDAETVEELTKWICAFIRDEEERPSIGRVDKQASDRLEAAGYDVPLESHLDPA
ncbi:hypothetical protein [Halobaculum sp. D14]|uniref:hypothetical protein n=1 Tax=Halobaculum sp. D14 TaxID=3421642 RepID=UPI003EBE66F5